MARLIYSVLAYAALLSLDGAVAAPTWPSSVDELEDIMYLNSGYRARGFAAPVTPCSAGQGPGRVTAAEYIRTAFHDMATGNTFLGIGGLDASILFELGGDQGDNIGAAFPSTLTLLAPFYSSKSSLADVIALSMYTAVRSCGGPAIPFRSGRTDATEAAPPGVPLPQNSLFTFRNQFDRVGFDPTEMIQVVACGHTLGGVHSANFPTIVPEGSSPNGVKNFDSTTSYDEKVASEYVSGQSTDPLVVGPSNSVGRASDFRVFNSDGNATISAMANPTTFRSVCKTLLQKMIDVVPAEVVLTDPIVPYDVKPTALQLTLLSGGTKLRFTGDIRVRTTSRAASLISKVELIYKDGSAGSSCGACLISTTVKGTAAGFDDSFTFYGFSAEIPAVASISSFDVVITLTSGTTETYNNNGAGYPIQDKIMLQSPQSCLASDKLTVVAAVRTGSAGPASLDLTLKVPRDGLLVPGLQPQSVAMTKGITVGPYDLYTATYTLAAGQTSNTKFSVSLSGSSSDAFKSVADLGTTCTPLSGSAPSSTMVTSVSSTSSTTTPPTTGPTLTGYTYEGCYTDFTAGRVFTGRSTSSNTMSYSACASFCSTWTYFGVEYGRECYCGNAYSAPSTLSPATDCKMKCTGDATQVCGAGNRMNVFRSMNAPPGPAKVPGWGYQGCYTDSGSARVLAGKVYYDSKLTNEKCAAACKGYTYFGTEYTTQCYCGNEFKNPTTKTAEGGMYSLRYLLCWLVLTLGL